MNEPDNDEKRKDLEIDKLRDRARWIELNKDSIDEALLCAGIAFLPKNNKEGLLAVKNDRWYWDLDLLSGKTKQLGLGIYINGGFADEEIDYNINYNPSTFKSKNFEWITKIEKPKSDKDAVIIINKLAKQLLLELTVKGAKEFSYSYAIGDGDYEGGIDWVFGGKKPVYFKYTKGRGTFVGFKPVKN